MSATSVSIRSSFLVIVLLAAGFAANFTGCSPNSSDTGVAEADRTNGKTGTAAAAPSTPKPAVTPSIAEAIAESEAAANAAVNAAAAAAISANANTSTTDGGQEWDYSANENAMSGGTTRFASIDSTNVVNLGFPYGGPQRATLTLRTDPQYGKDVLFRIPRGQIICSPYDGCTVQVRFDDEKPIRFPANGPTDQSSNALFLNGYDRFLTKLRKARRARIAITIYEQGLQVFEFDVGGFDFHKFQSKS